MGSERIVVEPEVLVWARRAIEMGKPLAAQKLGISESTLEKWESGSLAPTIKQLRKTAAVYRVPLAVLLLSAPPSAYQPIRDYRRAVSGDAAPISTQLHTELRRAEMQREVFLELSVLSPGSVVETEPLPELTMSMPPEEAGRLLREYTGVRLRERRSWQDPSKALNAWIAAVERKGVLVVHTTRVPVDEVRGFSFSDMPFPVVGLNGSDWPRPRIFTLFHELAHIALNAGGVCDLHESEHDLMGESDRLEHFCNAAAAAAIAPSGELLSSDAVSGRSREHEWSVDELKQIADRHMMSSEALLLRLIDLERAPWSLYWNLKQKFEDIYDEALAGQKLRRKGSRGGPSYYVMKARNIGHGYAHSVLDAYKSHAISSLDVSDYLQVKYNQIPKLEKVLR